MIVGGFLNRSVDTGFVLALPFHHGDLELDSVRLSTKDHVAILVAWPCLGGAICEVKIPVQELQLKCSGGLGSVYWTGLLDWTTGLARIKLVPDIFTVDPDIRIQYPIILLVWSRHMEYEP